MSPGIFKTRLHLEKVTSQLTALLFYVLRNMETISNFWLENYLVILTRQSFFAILGLFVILTNLKR